MLFPSGPSVLLLIRNEQANDLQSLLAHFGLEPYASYYLTSALDDLERARLIEKDPAGTPGWSGVKIKATPHLGELQQTLSMSLSRLAESSPDSIVVTPYFGRPVKPDRATDIFVVMPFKKELQSVYQDHIRRVAAQLNFSVQRADDFFSAHHVMTDVWQGIWSARAIIADCTGRNPNVFYEIGIAHTIGRPVILITQKRADVPFDLQAVRYLQYEYTPRGMTDFEERLKSTILTVLGAS